MPLSSLFIKLCSSQAAGGWRLAALLKTVGYHAGVNQRKSLDYLKKIFRVDMDS